MSIYFILFFFKLLLLINLFDKNMAKKSKIFQKWSSFFWLWCNAATELILKTAKSLINFQQDLLNQQRFIFCCHRPIWKFFNGPASFNSNFTLWLISISILYIVVLNDYIVNWYRTNVLNLIIQKVFLNIFPVSRFYINLI